MRDQGFLPAALVYFGLEKGTKATSPFLKEELLIEIKEKLPTPALFGSMELPKDSTTNQSSNTNVNPSSTTTTTTTQPKNDNKTETEDVSVTKEQAHEVQTQKEEKKKNGKGDIPKWFLAGSSLHSNISFQLTKIFES